MMNRKTTVIAKPIKPVVVALGETVSQGSPLGPWRRHQSHILRMPLSEWFAMRDNKRQRETEEHARKASRGHLKEPHPTHRNVSAARLPNGTLVKLDGHTRAFLWERGKLAAPEDGTVTVTVYDVLNIEESKSFYDTFDSSGAVMTSQDRIAGGKREHDLDLRSGCLSGSTSLHATSLKMADAVALHGVLSLPKSPTEYEILGRWKPILEMVDAQKYHRLDTGLLAGLLVTWLLHGGTSRLPSVADFWASYFEGRKSSERRRWLPMEAVRFRVETEKRFGAGRALNVRTLAYVCKALNAHLEGKTFLGKHEPAGLRLKDDERLEDVVMHHVRSYGGMPPVDQWARIPENAWRLK